MAHQNEANPKNVSRRSILQAGALAAAAAIVPAPVVAAAAHAKAEPADLLKDARCWYRELVESWAERKRAEFEAGRLHRWNDVDGEAAENTPGNYESAIDLFETEIKATLPDDDFRMAYLILACSPNEPNVDGGRELCDLTWGAAECIAMDVSYLARARGWYQPTADEEYMGQVLRGEPSQLYGPIPA